MEYKEKQGLVGNKMNLKTFASDNTLNEYMRSETTIRKYETTK
jgi:hypothetical protein